MIVRRKTISLSTRLLVYLLTRLLVNSLIGITVVLLQQRHVGELCLRDREYLQVILYVGTFAHAVLPIPVASACEFAEAYEVGTAHKFCGKFALALS